ncbi:MAG: hypothetical protein JWL96_697 [Sphingomonas bacterium]|nr:hypothetical protein [Sphingomonas bacterium]
MVSRAWASAKVRAWRTPIAFATEEKVDVEGTLELSERTVI